MTEENSLCPGLFPTGHVSRGESQEILSGGRSRAGIPPPGRDEGDVAPP